MVSFLERKLDEVRQEPEHVRIRYVWASVAVIMTILFLFWVMMLRDGFRASSLADSNSMKDVIPPSAGSLVKEGESIGQMVGKAQSLAEEGLSASNAAGGIDAIGR
ncbi:MAG TPA: hypothetical protein VN420_02045 [Candidatus Fimivivens sp.]|nr:hypothetical protein [Candidatus Fimivivens sp.]